MVDGFMVNDVLEGRVAAIFVCNQNLLHSKTIFSRTIPRRSLNCAIRAFTCFFALYPSTTLYHADNRRFIRSPSNA